MNLVPFDPNGMVMDFLRSCSRQKISFVENDPSTQVPAIWYYAAPTAKAFPTEHAFGSPVWDSVHPTVTTLGFDATKPRSYYNGRRINTSDGTSFAGPASFFQIGCPAPALLPRGVGDTPVECLDPPFGLVTGGLCLPTVPARGGLRTGGFSTQPIIPGVPCANCPGVTSLTMTVTLGGFPVPYTDYNGTFVLTQSLVPCTWFLARSGTHAITLIRNTATTWLVNLAGSLTVAAYLGTSGDCILPATLNQTFSFIGGNQTCVVSAP